MKQKYTMFVILLLASIDSSGVYAGEYPICLISIPSIAIPNHLANDELFDCLENHLSTHGFEEQTNLNVSSAYNSLLQIEQLQVNLVVVKIEDIGSVLVVASTLTEEPDTVDTVDTVGDTMANGNDWSELGRLTARISTDNRIVGQLQGEIEFWEYFNFLRPIKLKKVQSESDSFRQQHFHLIRIQCD